MNTWSVEGSGAGGSRRARDKRLRLRISNTATVTRPTTTTTAATRTRRPVRAIRRDHPLGVIRSGQFRMYWTAGFLTFTAFSMQMLTRGWLMEQLTGSPFLVALVVAGMMLPMLFLSLFGGVLADRLDRRKIIVASDISTFAGFVVVTLLAVFDVLAPWHLIAISFWNGAGFALAMPARQTLVGGLVHREQLRTAVGLSMTTYSTAQIVGASAAGFLIAKSGPDWALGVSAAMILPAIFAYSALHRPRGMSSTNRREPMLTTLKSGLAFTFASPALRTMMVGALIVMFTIGPFQALMPIFAAKVLDVGPAALGNLVLAAGCGSLAGSLGIVTLGGRFDQRKIAIASGVIAALTLTAFAASSWFPISIVLITLTSMAMTAFMVNNMTGVQMEVPDSVRGRVLSLRFLVIGMQPVGGLLVGALAEVYGAQVAVAVFALAGAGMLLGVHLLRTLHERRESRESAESADG